MAGEDPRDAFVSNQYDSFEALPEGAVVGSASLRRVSQLKHLRPDLEFKVCRGNLQTRLRKLDEGQYDALILAVAGLERMGLAERITQRISIEDCLPAVGQGVLGLEARLDDPATLERIQVLLDATTAQRIAAERGVSTRLDGGCQVPLRYTLSTSTDNCGSGSVGAADGSQLMEVETTGHPDSAADMGIALAEQLLADGAVSYSPAPLDVVDSASAARG